MSSLFRNLLFAAAGLLVTSLAFGKMAQSGSRSPIFGIRLPPSYREWRVISVAHEAGSLNDFRVILGNEVAVKAFRSGRRPFPDGAMIARLAWKYVPSARNDAIFGQTQSFVAGDPINVQVEVKNSGRYAATGGWGYGQFENGSANPSETLIRTCNACHGKLPRSDDFVFTRYAP